MELRTRVLRDWDAGMKAEDVAAKCSVSLAWFFSRRRRHTRWPRDWSSDVCSSDLHGCDRGQNVAAPHQRGDHAAQRIGTEVVNFAVTLHADGLQHLAQSTCQDDHGYQNPSHGRSSECCDPDIDRSAVFTSTRESFSAAGWLNVVRGDVRPTRMTPSMMSVMPAHRTSETCSCRKSLPTTATSTYATAVIGKT